eukprot:TRINITY_DN141_c0_g1_i1.p1 TRINITY_DN141_c0_g1~~TRINITY_DN141_c0_g1_i1.p1  ORF type:complete len:239 (+),score=28.29 TRINITY_DN141_c0_g1_i1:43-759(+)
MPLHRRNSSSAPANLYAQGYLRLPDDFAGNLLKQKHNAAWSGSRRALNFFSWNPRRIVLSEGRLQWGSVIGGRMFTRGIVDFAFTDCEVSADPDSSTIIILRPKAEQVWSDLDFSHRWKGSSRAYFFDTDCIHAFLSRSRDEWIEHFEQHISYGQARARGELDQYITDMEAALASLEDPSEVMADGSSCGICLESLVCSDGELSVSRTPCGHLFHTACAKPWLRKSQTCPLCRQDLTC